MDFNVWQRVLIREALEKALRSQAYLLQFRYRHLFFFSSLEDLTLLDSDHLLHSQCRWMKKVFSFCKPTGTDRKSLMHTDILFPGSISTQFASQGIASDHLSTVSSLRSNKSQWPSNMLYLCFLLVAWPLSNWNLCHFLGIWLLVYRIYIRMHVAKDITKTQISQWCVNMVYFPFTQQEAESWLLWQLHNVEDPSYLLYLPAWTHSLGIWVKVAASAPTLTPFSLPAKKENWGRIKYACSF